MYMMVDTSFWTHRTTLKVVARLGEGTEANILRFRSACIDQAQDGDLSDFEPVMIEQLAGWRGERGQFFVAACQAGVLELPSDLKPEGCDLFEKIQGLRYGDWWTIAGKFIYQYLKRSGQKKLKREDFGYCTDGSPKEAQDRTEPEQKMGRSCTDPAYKRKERKGKEKKENQAARAGEAASEPQAEKTARLLIENNVCAEFMPSGKDLDEAVQALVRLSIRYPFPELFARFLDDYESLRTHTGERWRLLSACINHEFRSWKDRFEAETLWDPDTFSRITCPECGSEHIPRGYCEKDTDLSERCVACRAILNGKLEEVATV